MNRESEPPGATTAKQELECLASTVALLSSTTSARLDAVVDAAFETTQVAWLQALVNIPSFSRTRDDVEVAAAYLDQTMADMGLSATRVADPQGTFADHRVYATPATAAHDRALALVGHIDTVFPRSLGFLTMRREETSHGLGDKIFGPGVLDMKSGLSAIVFALRALREAAPELWQRARIRFVCNTDEEVGSPSSAALFESLATRTSAALVFEAGRVNDRIVTRRKGGASFTIVATGKAAHSGNDHAAGVSAIHALALIIPRIEALTDYTRNVTVNVGTFQGGTSRNTVPESAACEIDTRFASQRDAHALVEAIQAIVREPFVGLEHVPDKLRQVQFDVKGRVSRPPMEPVEGTAELLRAYEACAQASGLNGGEAGLQGGGSDANLLAAAGVPCIDGLGPFGQYFHQTEEWSSLASLRARTKALARFLAVTALGQTASVE